MRAAEDADWGPALGHVRQAADLAKRGLLDDPPWFQICLGVPWGIDGDLEGLLAMKSRLPENSQWSVLGVGSMNHPCPAASRSARR